MGVGMLVALTIPGLSLLLIVLTVVEAAASRLRRRSPLYRRRRRSLSASCTDTFAAALAPGKAIELDEHRAEAMRRDDPSDGAPPRSRIDLDGRVAYLVLPTR